MDIPANTDYQLITDIIPSIFRSYDIRGIAGEELSENVVYTIARALGSIALERNQTSIIIGRDGRLSGPTLKQALCHGLLDSGINVIDIGIVPTPLVYFATHRLETNSGIMLTGSHNPVNYNGLKIVLAGKTLNTDEIQAVYQRIIAKNFKSGKGVISTHDVIPDYLHYVKDIIKLKRPLHIVVDGGNGVGGKIALPLYRALGCKVESLFCDIDGNFPNHHPDPTIPKNLSALIAKVKETGADCGLAFDGDADRLGVVTSNGDIIWPDRLLMLFVKDVIPRHPGASVVFDVKCSTFLPKVIKEAGGNPIMWQTGHSILKAKMHEEHSPVSGELSGHIFFNERWLGFDDGVYIGARLLEILANDNRKSAEIFAELPNSVNTPELKIPMLEAEKHAFVKTLQEKGQFPGGTVYTIDGVRVDFDNGFGLVRASNTTPCLTVRFEADTEEHLEKVKNLFREQLKQLKPDIELPF